MNNYPKMFFKLFITSSLFASNAVFADDINHVLKSSHAFENNKNTPAIIKINKNPQTLNDYVLNSRIIYEEKHAGTSFIAATNKIKKINGWQDVLGTPPSL